LEEIRRKRHLILHSHQETATTRSCVTVERVIFDHKGSQSGVLRMFGHCADKKATFVLAMIITISVISSLHQVRLGIATPHSQQTVELGYDDGTMDRSWYWSGGAYAAVRFSPSLESSRILSVRYFIVGHPAKFSVLILDSDRKSVYETSAVPTSTGWFAVDLSANNIVVNGEFYAAMKWTTKDAPELGADESKPTGRSFFVYQDGSWYTYPEVISEVIKKNVDGNFMIRVKVAAAPKVQIVIRIEPSIKPLLPSTGIRVDGISYSTSRLPVTFVWEIGFVHTLEVDPMIDGAAGVRYVFVEWSDGYGAALYSIEVEEEATYSARFKTQYLLTVDSPMGSPQGSGWCDEGSSATFSVTSPLPVDGFVGMLGGRYVFDHWSGDSTTSGTSASITMDGPKTVRAEWRTDYTIPAVVVGVIVATVAVSAVLLMRRNARGPRAVTAAGTPSRYVEYLAKLEELRTRGEISEKTYRKLKDEYWKKIPERNT